MPSTWSKILPLCTMCSWWCGFQHCGSSVKSEELGLAGRKRTIQMWEGSSHPVKDQQVHLKGIFQLQKLAGVKRHLATELCKNICTGGLKRTFLLAGFMKKKEKEKRNICSFTSISSFFFHKNKRWFFKVPVSALFAILICVQPNN